MPKSCAARQCCNRYSNRRKQLTFHRFPFSRPELLREWVLNLGRADFKPKQHTVICSEHFRPECFSAFGNRKNLKHNAVPTVFAPRDRAQLAGVSTEPAGECGDGNAAAGEVRPEAGAGRSMEAAPGEHPSPGGPEDPSRQVLPPSLAAPEPAGRKRPPPKWPSDHSYALLDLDTLKRKLFLTLKENEKLRRRLRAQRLEMRRLSSRLRAPGEGRQPEPGR
ncbi:THAP domain-containing protein 3 [Perognathus longimembris pacificus]|uniref:THAP domain-containing protein 3 n=1 Tax=Perognathus longimembris pacificus TaxID=214514 RepID=UPI0020188C8A|nr:THAP domain-containing protein 3 [Perognathus longimembris pacificus]